jgi:hypothetical protein|uniref:Uncharacterized protein n=1 Tax=Zea mays TaxID=4577 RepID=A0A804PYY4_MAIZE
MHRRAAIAVARELKEGGLNVEASAHLHELGEAGSSRAQGWRRLGGDLGRRVGASRAVLAEGWCGRQKEKGADLVRGMGRGLASEGERSIEKVLGQDCGGRVLNEGWRPVLR